MNIFDWVLCGIGAVASLIGLVIWAYLSGDER